MPEGAGRATEKEGGMTRRLCGKCFPVAVSKNKVGEKTTEGGRGRRNGTDAGAKRR